jgi:hypothetical protein
MPAATNHRGVEKHRRKFDPHQPDGDPLHSLDLLLKHPNETLEMKHLKHVYETLEKNP